MTEKFKKKQEYAEETDGSNISNTECEMSSEEKNNKDIRVNTNCSGNTSIPIKHKRALSCGSEKDEPKEKSLKTIYMESVDLTPSKISKNVTNKEIIDDLIIVPDKIIALENTDDETNKKMIINSKEVTNEVSKTITDNKNNSDKNLENNMEVDEYHSNNESNDVLVIDEDKCNKVNADETIIKEPQANTNNDNAITIDSEDEPIITEPIITEPEVILNYCEGSVKDTIEIKEFDDSDVIITTTSTPNKVPVQNKKSLESIIKSSM